MLTLGCARQSIQASLMLCSRWHESCECLCAVGAHAEQMVCGRLWERGRLASGHREATLTCDTLNRIHGQRTDNEVTSTLDQVVISELVGINHNKADKFL